MDSDMNILKNWAATIAGAVIVLLIVLLEITDSANTVKAFVWIIGFVLLAAGLAFDLFRQKKLKLPA
jgi:uncharacterized membrane protein HdeD (DUF308 family)